MPLPATVEVPADDGDISFDCTPGACAPEVAQDAALDGVLKVCLRAEVNTSGGEPRLGFVPELIGVPGTRRTGAGEVSADDLDVTTAGAQDYFSEDAESGGVSVRRANGASPTGCDEDELSAH